MMRRPLPRLRQGEKEGQPVEKAGNFLRMEVSRPEEEGTPMNSVHLTRQGPVAVLTLDNPPLNIITTAMFRRLGERIDEVDADPALRVAVIQGAGEQHFTAGADISEMAGMAACHRGDDLARQVRLWLDGVQAVLSRIERSPKVFICAMKGLSYGGGIETAAACDVRVAAADARFAMPEVKIGLIPGYGGTQRLLRLLGKGRALAFILSAEPVDAITARGMGLVDVLAPDGAAEATALRLATAIAGHAPLALAGVKRAIHGGAHLDLEAACRLEADLFTQVAITADVRAGLAAFMAKRPPRFQGL